MDREEYWSESNYGGKQYLPLLELLPYRRLLLDTVREADVANERVLEVGCGPGTLTTLIKQHEPAGLLACDYSDDMLRVAREREPSVDFRQIDLSTRFIDSLSEQVTRIVAGNVLYTLPDPGFTLQQLRTLLLPGGRIILTTPIKDADVGKILLEHYHTVQTAPVEHDVSWSLNGDASDEQIEQLIRLCFPPRLHDAFKSIVRANLRLLADPSLTYYRPAELETILQEVGFATVSTRLVYAGQAILATASL